MKNGRLICLLVIGISAVYAVAEENNSTTNVADAIMQPKLSVFSFARPAYMKVTEIPVGTIANSTNGIVFSASAYPTNQLSAESVSRITLDGFRKAAAKSKKIQWKNERTVQMKIMGQRRAGTLFEDIYNGKPRTSSIYLFPQQGNTVVILFQNYDRDSAMAKDAFSMILESLKMETPQQRPEPY